MLSQFKLGILGKDQKGNGSTAAGILIGAVVIIILIGLLVLWLISEPNWWESLLGKTRWDKIVETFQGWFGR